MAMEDFTVKRLDGPNGKNGWYMYIGFSERPKENSSIIDCSGTVLVLPDGKTEHWFNYSFAHSWDWNEITAMRITPVRKSNKLSIDDLYKVSSDIVHHILDFICMRN